MIYTDKTLIRWQDPLPDAVDTVVIGGGVIGVSTAWFLQQRGASVLICDKGRIAGEQSSRNWGWVRQQGRDADELPIAIESVNSWESIAAELDEDIGFTRQGVLYTAANESQMADLRNWLDLAQQHQLDTRLLSSAEVDALTGGPRGMWYGGLYTPSDGRAEPWKAVPAVAAKLGQRGVAIRENCAVRSIETSGGRVSGVITEAGTVRAQSVVLAGGAWSTMFLGNLGVRLPQLTVRATVARTNPAPEFMSTAAALGDVALRRRADGGYTVAPGGVNEHFISADSFRFFFPFLPVLRASRRTLNLRMDDGLIDRLLPKRRWLPDETTPFEQTRVLNPEPSQRALERMRIGLQRRAPQLADVPFAEAWAGMIDVTPDVVPVMDEIPSHPGLFLATGFSGHGFGFGPGAGRVMADLVTGRPPVHDLSRFRFSRFSDGTPMRPGPGL